jgi:hypothetical protein
MTSERSPATTSLDDDVGRRWLLRRVAAGVCAGIAAVYALIGAGAVTVAEPVEGMDMVTFGAGAAAIFVVGAVLLLTVERRPLWAGGAVLQVLMFAMYLAVSTERTPPFEAWGIGIRVAQVVLLGLLVTLALPSRAAAPHASGAGRRRLERSAARR